MSAITAKQATAAVEEHREQCFTPQNTPRRLILEVMATLVENVDDEAHLKRTMKHLRDNLRYFPAICEVLEAIRLTRESRQDDDGFIPMGCPECDWTGYVVRTINGYSGAEPCRCFLEGRMQPQPDDKQATAHGAQAKQMVRQVAQERRVG